MPNSNHYDDGDVHDIGDGGDNSVIFVLIYFLVLVLVFQLFFVLVSF